jgi:hypothetical protein
MPQSDNQVEANELPADVEAAVDSAGVDAERLAIQNAAAIEEQNTARMLQQVAAAQETPQEVNIVAEAAKGREHFLQKVREHRADSEAKKAEHKPPPLTERQRAMIAEEQAAGIKARERHEAELASRPPPPAKEKWDGSNTPVHRPNDVVPDPLLPAGSFAAGTKQFSADA